MAVVWVKQAGNWTDTTLWAFWNETTQQIEDYGQVPQSGDVVYLNGYTLTSYNGTGFSIKELRNDLNPYTSNIGGVFQIAQQNKTFTFDIYAESLIINSTGMWGSTGLTFNGNIQCIEDTYGGNLISLGNTNGLITINGNVNINNAILFSSTYTSFKLAINGNVSASQNGKLIDGTTAYGTLTINGFTQAVANNIPFTTINISGDLKLQDGNIIRGTNISISGQNCDIGTNSAINGTNISISSENITYRNGSLGVCGFISTNPLSFTNVKHYTNVSEPNLLPYVILTDYEIHNTQQYPSVTDVKKDVPYAYGQLVGTYQADYPSESVVLHDIVYADGDMVGTLEPVSNTNIINIIKR